MSIGILGGTFDPVHNAHLEIARLALNELQLQKILFIPTGAQRYRKPPLASAEHRVAMLKLALEGEPRYEVDARELAAGASGYTVDTLESLRADFPDYEWVLLMGSDQYAKFDSWRRPHDVARLAKIAVFARPGFAVKNETARFIPMQPMTISASDLRARLARGEDISAMVPGKVANYIARHRLYG